MKNVYLITGSLEGTKLFENNFKIIKILSKNNIVFTDIKNLSLIKENVKSIGYIKTKKSLLKRLFRDLKLFYEFRDKNKINILFSLYHEMYYGPLIVILSKLYKKKSIVRMAGNPVDAYKYKKTWFNRVMTYIIEYKIALSIIKHADRIIVMSQELKDKLIAEGYNSQKIKIIMQPLDYSEFKLKSENKIPKNKLKLSKTKKNVLFVGTLTKRKGLDTIINFLKNNEINKKFHFIFAGEDKEGYSKKIKKFKNITLLGNISKELLINYYHHVDLFFFPSNIEGFPKVITEAYATGCPIVARNIMNIDRLADFTFEKDEEALKILLEKEFKRKKKIIWPEEFKSKVIKKSYLDLVREL